MELKMRNNPLINPHTPPTIVLIFTIFFISFTSFMCILHCKVRKSGEVKYYDIKGNNVSSTSPISSWGQGVENPAPFEGADESCPLEPTTIFPKLDCLGHISMAIYNTGTTTCHDRSPMQRTPKPFRVG